jgi:hypothetical protein
VVTWGRGLRSAEFLSRLLGIYWFGGKDGGQVYLFIYLFIYSSPFQLHAGVQIETLLSAVLQTRLEIPCMWKLGFSLFSALFLESIARGCTYL